MPELGAPPMWAVALAKIVLRQGSRFGTEAVDRSFEPTAYLLAEGDFIWACGGAAVRRLEGDMVVIIDPEHVLAACCNDLQRAVIHFILAEASL